ncbi:hypothetical protein FOZ63_003871, partial [Perkinsus olseni]
ARAKAPSSIVADALCCIRRWTSPRNMICARLPRSWTTTVTWMVTLRARCTLRQARAPPQPAAQQSVRLITTNNCPIWSSTYWEPVLVLTRSPDRTASWRLTVLRKANPTPRAVLCARTQCQRKRTTTLTSPG